MKGNEGPEGKKLQNGAGPGAAKFFVWGLWKTDRFWQLVGGAQKPTQKKKKCKEMKAHKAKMKRNEGLKGRNARKLKPKMPKCKEMKARKAKIEGNEGPQGQNERK